ncbi:MAG: galactokinase [Anaerolineales bacterium]|jgi:galactokinase
MTPRLNVLQGFQDQYSEKPRWITRSPGRVNIIGEHTDYNAGFVLPMAIDYAAWVALKPRSDRLVRVTALDKDQTSEFSLDDLSKGQGDWQDYLIGVAWALQQEGFELNGWEGTLAGDVPIGAGLSSSAALELAVARAFCLASKLEWDPRRMALICQNAENHWVGVNSGIMDQMVSACGKENSALLIDCRSLETRQVPLPDDIRVVILDTTTRRGLVDSTYNELRAQCEAVACHFDADALRDVSLEQLLDSAGLLNITLYHRARHVITENQRVLEAVQALEKGDGESLGRLMNESHRSLRDDYRVSREELDQMVEIAQAEPGCFGARMTGAGFGGCAVALVKADLVEDFEYNVPRKFLRKTGLEPKVYLTEASNGTSFEEIS